MGSRKMFLAALCSFTLLTGAAFAQDDYSTWSQTSDITINTTAAGLNVPGNVLKFPYLVRLDSTFNFAQSIGRGVDVRFSKTGGTHLRYQRESWDSAGKKAAFWVLLDTVYGNNATQAFRMHWGKAAAGDSSNGARVFEASNGFVGVWHLANDSDATVNANHANGTANLPSDTVGIIGGAKKFNPSVAAQFLTIPNAASLNFGGVNLTLSAWINAVSYCPCEGGAPANRRILQKGAGGHQYRIAELTDDNFLQFDLGSATNETDLGQAIADEVTTPENSWHLVHGIYDGLNVSFYTDGGLRFFGTTWGAEIGISETELRIGGDPTTGTTARDSWYGQIDEVRIQSVARSDNWVKLEWANQKTAAEVSAPVRLAAARAALASQYTVKAMNGGMVFRLPGASKSVQVAVLDVGGRTVWSRTTRAAELVWDGNSTQGQRASRGVYIVRMTPLDQPGSASVNRVVTFAP